MKVLLTTLNSKYVHSNLALKYLYAVAKKKEIDVTLQEFTINNPMEYVYGEIVRGGYDLICISCYIWNIEKIKELTSEIKQADSHCKIMLGGPEVSYETETFMTENPHIDYILRGEGEAPFEKVCEAIKNGETDFSVPGLAYRKEGTIFCNPLDDLASMESIPFPYEYSSMEKDKVLYYESSRGCPYRCAYCLSSIDKRIRSLSVERTERELRTFLDEEVKQVKFIDRTFNFDKDRAYRLWEFLIENDNGKTNFHFEICGELLEDRHFRLLEKAREGLFQFEIGIQSTYDKALIGVDRNPSVSKLLENVRRLIKTGNSHIHVDLIAGLPYEDYDTFGKSFDNVYALKAQNLQLGFLKLLKGTKIRKNAEESQYIYRQKAPYEIISNKWISAMELIRLKMTEELLDLYHNKGGFEQSVEFLMETLNARPFSFYEMLAEYYYDMGHQHRSHKKEDLYRILMKFAEKTLGENSPEAEKAREIIADDLAKTMNFDAVKKFHKKGWEI